MTNSSTAPAPVQLVFFGEIVNGHAPDDARRKLAAAVGMTQDQIENAFSGRRVVLKKSLSAEEAPRYLDKLARIGIVARAEPDPSPGKGAQPIATASSADSAVSKSRPANEPLAVDQDRSTGQTTLPVEEIACPKCGTRQAKRTLCLSCSTDMPRYAAAQKVLHEETRAARIAALKGSTNPASPGRDAADADYAIEGASLLGTSFDGRVGRIAYLTGSSIIGSVGILGVIAALKSGLWVLLIPLVLGTLFVSLRLAILRCHDLGWSGWWSLVSLVPYAGSLFSLILLIVPGTRGGNDFGRPSRPPGVPALATSIVVLLLAALLGFTQMAKIMPLLGSYGMQGSNASGQSIAGAGDYDPRNNTVVMYSLTTCGYCVAKRRELEQMGIHYTELFLDGEGNAQEQLSSRLEQSGMPRQAYGTPILDVNGVILPNNPPIEEVAQHLRGSRS